PLQRKREADRRRKDAPRTPASPANLPRAGAGLELDLSGPRQGGDRLPGDLRAALPQRGLVNYFEAQAVVRRLEELFAAAESPGRVGVLALYPAQAELIRQLVRRTPRLAGFTAAL